MYEYAPIVRFSQCTSRTYSWVDTNANSTDDDGLDEDDDAGIFPPYRPDGYFCDLSRTDGNNDSDVIVGLCRACLGSSDRCLDDHNVLNNSTTSPITIKGGALEMASIGECREQCGVETNICSSTQVCPSGLFCNLESDEDGYCHGCPLRPIYCSDIRNGDKNLIVKGLIIAYRCATFSVDLRLPSQQMTL
jgi:hypothetical protein